MFLSKLFRCINLLCLDKIWCGKTQVPAFYLEKLTNDKSRAKKLAKFRIMTGLSLVCEIFGYFFITLGLTSQAPIVFFAGGILLKIGGGLFTSVLLNKSGSLWSLELYSYLKTIKSHSQEIHTALANKGCSENEIQALLSLPSDIYQTELNSFQRSRLFNFGIPIACGIALSMKTEMFSGLIIIILGIVSFPIGEYFFNEYTFRSESKLRLGRSAQILGFIDQVYREHIFQTFQINLISQIPLLLFFLRFFFNAGNLLAVFFGFTQGLIGLSGTLAFQRLRITSTRITQTAEHLINALSSEDFIITPERWKAHCSQSVSEIFEDNAVKNGVVFRNFSISLSSRLPQYSISLNCFIPAGRSCILQAPSGYGKSTLLMSLMHMLEHKGDIYFVEKGNWKNVHDLSLIGLQKKIFFCREENIDKSSRLVDLFQDILIRDLSEIYLDMIQKFGKEITDLAWKAPDNLLEKECDNIQEGKQSVFPKIMISSIKIMRQKRADLVQAYLKNAQGNLAVYQIFPERNFASLSSGEKRRLVCLLAFEEARTNSELQLVILDEPLAHLDTKSLQEQIDMINKIQKLPHSPAQLIIAHHFIEELSNNLTDAILIKI